MMILLSKLQSMYKQLIYLTLQNLEFQFQLKSCFFTLKFSIVCTQAIVKHVRVPTLPQDIRYPHLSCCFYVSVIHHSGMSRKYGNPVYMCPSLLINSFIIFIMIVVAYYYTDKELTRWTPTKLSYSSLNTNLKVVLSLPLACSVFSRRSARRKQRRFSQLVIMKTNSSCLSSLISSN